jgi:hypothetical protein
MHETLDETIDRVAGEMSVVSRDPGLTARVRAGMDAPRRPWLMPTLAVASVAMAVVLATGLWPRVERAGPPDSAHREIAANAVTPVAPLASPRERVWRHEPARPTMVGETVTPLRDRASRSVDLDGAGSWPSAEGRAPVPPHLAAAWADAGEPAGPAPLAVAELIIAPMAGLDEVAIAPLDVVPLHVPELQVTERPQE